MAFFHRRGRGWVAPLLCIFGGLSALPAAFAQGATPPPALRCPVEQPTARNGTAPDPAVLRQLVRCRKGEKAAQPGYDGAVSVEVTALKVGSPRPWSYQQDIGQGQPGTMVYPVQATYTVRTHYKTRIATEENWIRVLNFHVDGFGAWQVGSEVPVKSPEVKDVPVR